MRAILAALALLCFSLLSNSATAATISCHPIGGNAVTIPYGGDPNKFLGGTVCAQNFYFSGKCNGQDQNPPLEAATFDSPFVTPWEPVSISIVDVQIVFINGSQPQSFYAFAGNGYDPDIMSWLTSDGADRHLPDGYNMQFPASGGTKPPHLDLHVSCLPVGFSYQGFYNVIYQPNPT